MNTATVSATFRELHRSRYSVLEFCNECKPLFEKERHSNWVPIKTAGRPAPLPGGRVITVAEWKTLVHK